MHVSKGYVLVLSCLDLDGFTRRGGRQDEKMMMLLRTKKVRWRLFWVLEIVGFSFWLALVGVLYLGDPYAVSPSLNTNSSTTSADVASSRSLSQVIKPYFTFAFYPGTVTCCALVVNDAVWKLGAAVVAKRSALVATTKGSKRVHSLFLCFDVFRDVVCEDPFFAVTWAALVVASFIMGGTFSHSVVMDSSKLRTDLIVSGSVIAACFAAALVGLCVRRCVHSCFGGSAASARSRLATLCVGWGIGAAIGMTVVSDAKLQSTVRYSLVGGLIVFLLGIIALVDFESFGWSNFYARVKPALSVLQNTDGFVYWGIVGGVAVCMGAWVTHVHLGVVWGIIE